MCGESQRVFLVCYKMYFSDLVKCISVQTIKQGLLLILSPAKVGNHDSCVCLTKAKGCWHCYRVMAADAMKEVIFGISYFVIVHNILLVFGQIGIL